MQQTKDCCGQEVNDKDNKKSIGTYVLIGLAIAVLVFSVVQAVQLGSVQRDISAGNSGAAAIPAGATTRQQPSAAPTPAMVGGC